MKVGRLNRAGRLPTRPSGFALRAALSRRLAVAVLTTALPATALPSAYHSPDEIAAVLHRWEQNYPEWVRVDSVGHTSQNRLPIWMAKMSDRPSQDEDEPALLFIGQVHAEEVLGVEIVMELMRQLLENAEDGVMRERLEQLELFFIPTANPEGLEVVHSGLDSTFRKNCRDNVGDGRFRFRPGPGGDSSGVDLNRNFGLHWDRGDTLFCPSDPPYTYNYYRGPAPFSEPEAAALRDLALDKRFLFSVCYHSSRSGRDAERVIAPWSWDGKRPPDAEAVFALADTLAALTVTADGQNRYFAVAGGQRVGQSQDWFYQATGTFQYLIEVGRNIQPDSAEMAEVRDANLDAAWFLMDLARGATELPGFGILTVHTVAEGVGAVSAEVGMTARADPVLEPRRTRAATGRLDWLLPAGVYDVRARRSGYAAAVDTVQMHSGERVDVRVELARLPVRRCEVAVTDAASGRQVPAQVVFTDATGAAWTFDVGGAGAVVELPEGEYRVRITAGEFLPAVRSATVDGRRLVFPVYSGGVVFTEEFDANRFWQQGGAGGYWTLVQAEGRRVLTESPDGDYANRAATWLVIDTGVDLDTLHPTAVELIHRIYFEPNADWGWLQIFNRAAGDWDTLAGFSGFPQGWRRDVYDLTGAEPGRLVLRFMVTSDAVVTEDGWWIDRVAVWKSGAQSAGEGGAPTPAEFSLAWYPNPFNGSGRAVVVMDKAADVEVNLLDAGGRLTVRMFAGELPAGRHQLNLAGEILGRLPSGVYALECRAGPSRRAVPVALVR